MPVDGSAPIVLDWYPSVRSAVKFSSGYRDCVEIKHHVSLFFTIPGRDMLFQVVAFRP
jgi:hypothetical protein